jgi:hypothetical protein
MQAQKKRRSRNGGSETVAHSASNPVLFLDLIYREVGYTSHSICSTAFTKGKRKENGFFTENDSA